MNIFDNIVVQYQRDTFTFTYILVLEINPDINANLPLVVLKFSTTGQPTYFQFIARKLKVYEQHNDNTILFDDHKVT